MTCKDIALSLAPPAESQNGGTKPPLFLYPGQIFASTEPRIITIIVGSCIAVCLWDPVSCVGGATHYLLPIWDSQGVPSPRYGDVAIESLLKELKRLGAERRRLQAKIFGGNCVLKALGGDGGLHVGNKNLQVAREMLAQNGIPIVVAEVDGERGQKIYFHTDDGEASVKTL